MKTIRVSKRDKAVNTLLHQARTEGVIVKDAEGAEYMVTIIDDFDREIAAQRRSKKLMDFLNRRARSKEWIPLEEVERRLGLSPWPSNRRKNGRKIPPKK